MKKNRKHKKTVSHAQRVKLIEVNLKNMYMLLSAKGLYDIHKLKERQPELYDEIMGVKKK
jgi:hypothetical protein